MTVWPKVCQTQFKTVPKLVTSDFRLVIMTKKKLFFPHGPIITLWTAWQVVILFTWWSWESWVLFVWLCFSFCLSYYLTQPWMNANTFTLSFKFRACPHHLSACSPSYNFNIIFKGYSVGNSGTSPPKLNKWLVHTKFIRSCLLLKKIHCHI